MLLPSCCSLHAALAVGYGDIVATPFNDVEQVVASFIMLISGMIWGYLIGTFCNLASNLSPSVQLFRAELSQLNHFMSNEQVGGVVGRETGWSGTRGGAGGE